jgi:hypothetical protein
MRAGNLSSAAYAIDTQDTADLFQPVRYFPPEGGLAEPEDGTDAARLR